MTRRDHPAQNLGSRRGSLDTRPRSAYRFKAATVAAAMMSVTALAGTTATAGAAQPKHDPRNAFKQVNLVSDLDTFGPKVLVDPDVKNPWGIAMGPTTPLWVNNNFNPASNCGPQCLPPPKDLLTKVTLYRGANGLEKITKVEDLEVTASAPTGIVFNPTKSFKVKQNGVTAPARFLFDEITIPMGVETANVTGWSNATKPPPTVTKTKATKKKAVHLGLTLVPGKSTKPGKNGPHLLAADGINGVIDIYDGNFKRVHKKGEFKNAFVDPKSMSQKLVPYNVAFLKDRVYVAYAGEAGGGALSVFKKEGRFIKRLVTGKPLNGPWGMAVAPNNWGRFGGAILVGNVDDGTINAFNRRNGKLLGTLKNSQGDPLVNLGLWGLAFGNGTIGTPRTLLFAAGIGKEVDGKIDNVYEHGLVGLIKPVNDKN